jgi:hypothetical protein
VLEDLAALAPVEAVYGNMDEPALRTALPEQRVVEVGDVRIGMVHIPGAREGREERLVARFPGCHAVVYGHTHVPEVTRHGTSGSSTPAARPSGGGRPHEQCSSSRSSRAGWNHDCSSSLDTNTCSH